MHCLTISSAISFCPMADSSSVITGLNTGKRKQFNHLLHTKVAGAPLRSASCNLQMVATLALATQPSVTPSASHISADVQLPGYLAVILTIISQDNPGSGGNLLRSTVAIDQLL